MDQSFNQLEKYYKQLLNSTSNPMGLNDSGNESSEIVIEEKVRKKLANEFKMLESEASQGIKQREEAIKKRDEAIKRLKKEKDKIVKTMKDQEGNYGGMEAAQRKLKE